MTDDLDITRVRRQFPALARDQVFFDNAGGSQVLQSVIDSISSYLLGSNVQLGASYKTAVDATTSYNHGFEAVASYINATPSDIVLGPSTTQLFRNLSLTLFDFITPGSEIVISKLDHEANIAPWVQLAKWRQAKVVWWTPDDRYNPRLEPAVLRGLMNDRTRLVACTHTSNVLGTINDIRAIADAVHSFADAYLVVDAVAYAPHRQVDVKALGVDMYAFSWYKVYGPHIACLYVAKRARPIVGNIGHFFKSGDVFAEEDSLDSRMGLAGASYELVASIPKVCEYLQTVSWDQIARHEQALQALLIDYLTSKPERFQICGEPVSDRARRVPVLSFLVKGRKSKDVVEYTESKSEIGSRFGSFYSNRLVSDVLNLEPGDGVVRVSLVHYNTIEEVQRYIDILDTLPP